MLMATSTGDSFVGPENPSLGDGLHSLKKSQREQRLVAILDLRREPSEPVRAGFVCQHLSLKCLLKQALISS